jgi:hypothetical protein
MADVCLCVLMAASDDLGTIRSMAGCCDRRSCAAIHNSSLHPHPHLRALAVPLMRFYIYTYFHICVKQFRLNSLAIFAQRCKSKHSTNGEEYLTIPTEILHGRRKQNTQHDRNGMSNESSPEFCTVTENKIRSTIGGESLTNLRRNSARPPRTKYTARSRRISNESSPKLFAAWQ